MKGNPKENIMLLEDCFEVKLTLHYLLRLAGTSEGLNRPGWAALGSISNHLDSGLWLPPTPWHFLLIIFFSPTLTADVNELLTLRNVHLDQEH